MVTILMMPAKIATLGLLKTKLSWNKGYVFIIFVYDSTNEILSSDSNYIVDVVMWPKFGNSSIPMRNVIVGSIFIKVWPEKQLFLMGDLSSSSII